MHGAGRYRKPRETGIGPGMRMEDAGMSRWTLSNWACALPAVATARSRSVVASITTLRILIRSGGAALMVAALVLGGCGGGGKGGGSGGASPSLVVSGSVTAPSGQVAFDAERSYFMQLAAAVIARADAALTGAAPVADGTVVELVRIDHLGKALATLATTTTAGGKYSFNLTSLGLSPASDLVVQVVNVATSARMRAFVTSESVNLDPVSETVMRLVLEKVAATPGATLANLTVEEINDYGAAAGIVVDLSNVAIGTTVESAAAAIKTAISGNAGLTTFLGNAVNAGQSNLALGDVGNYFPIVQGKAMVYEGTGSFNGGTPFPFSLPQKYTFTGTKTVGGVEVSVLTNADQYNPVLRELYYRKTARALEFHGDNDPFDPLTTALVPYDEMRFPLRSGSSYEQFRKNNLDSGQDLDEDGKNERVNVVSTVSVAKVDGAVTVPSGTYTDVMRVETRLTFTFISSAFGDTATVYGTDINWLAPGVGPIKFSYEIASPEDGESQIETWVLTPKQDVQPEPPPVARVEIYQNTYQVPVALVVGGTQTLSATAYDSNGIPISGFPIAWSSSNQNVVAIEGSGQIEGDRIVRGAGIGTATITASLGGVSSSPLTVTVAEVRILPLATNDIVYDPGTARIYASVPGRAGAIGNSIVSIDPETGLIGTAVWVGSEPNKLARSDDGQFLYVGLDGAGAVRRFEIGTQTPGLQFSLGVHSFFGPMNAGNIAVLPGSPGSVAVARLYRGVSPGAAGVVIYDNDIKRPNEAPEFSGTGNAIGVIAFSASSSRLYGFDNQTSAYSLSRMTVTSQGINLDDVTRDLFVGPEVEVANSLVYGAGGNIFDPEQRALVGRFPLSTTYAANSLKTELARNRVYFLENAYSGWAIEAFNSQTLTPVGKYLVAGVVSPVNCDSLLRWGTNGVAFRCASVFSGDSSQDHVVLIRTHLVN